MKYLSLFILCLGITVQAATESEFYKFAVKKADGTDQKLSDYKGKVVLVVNVASKCGFTSQYEGLEKLYSSHEKDGFVILGFPANNFFKQEPGTNEEIQKFCKLTYGVKFPVFAKIDVKGDNTHELYKWLTTQKDFEGKITWNFNKFLLSRQGQVVKRYNSSDKPMSFEDDIIAELKKK